MTMLTRRESWGPLDLFEWLEGPWKMRRPVPDHPVRVEDYAEDDGYAVRAELPGINPEDFEVSVSKGILTIKANRAEASEGKRHSAAPDEAVRRIATGLRSPVSRDVPGYGGVTASTTWRYRADERGHTNGG